jgi:NTP pyrophosphatase (non-canonical NTP hydrolase)
MTKTEYLLIVLAEECAEVQKEISKALRFGIDTEIPNSSITYRLNLIHEIADVFAVIEMLENNNDLSFKWNIEEAIKIKKEKVTSYMYLKGDVEGMNIK